MSYYKTCPECGSALDPGEICDCRNEARTKQGQTPIEEQSKNSRGTEKAALSATNTESGGAERESS